MYRHNLSNCNHMRPWTHATRKSNKILKSLLLFSDKYIMENLKSLLRQAINYGVGIALATIQGTSGFSAAAQYNKILDQIPNAVIRENVIVDDDPNSTVVTKQCLDEVLYNMQVLSLTNEKEVLYGVFWNDIEDSYTVETSMEAITNNLGSFLKENHQLRNSLAPFFENYADVHFHPYPSYLEDIAKIDKLDLPPDIKEIEKKLIGANLILPSRRIDDFSFIKTSIHFKFNGIKEINRAFYVASRFGIVRYALDDDKLETINQPKSDDETRNVNEIYRAGSILEEEIKRHYQNHVSKEQLKEYAKNAAGVHELIDILCKEISKGPLDLVYTPREISLNAFTTTPPYRKPHEYASVHSPNKCDYRSFEILPVPSS